MPSPPPAPPRRLLVLGGARSGKSRFAQDAAEANEGEKVYIATAQAFDDEMRDRIARHRADRDARWRTREAPLDLAEAIAQETGPGRVVLVDCLTLWLSNTLLADRDPGEAGGGLRRAVRAARGPLILVSNEVGHGLVPDTPLGRAFRDAQGRLNQDLAQVCDRVVFVAAGCPVLLKPSPALDMALA
ncbi:bifunctional adenosylcobinamide kinase/adenosylcobinamide-phosphate guanylyltransferase [Microvirga pudoricolor]|uniref:bifunctional adenosylcobinamide kinase/adenosylcobinamide-phosphate guanylyltransferase n=1 Tax=Microvirga pudoricolor TaxID=2778729 RepID=UPI00194FE2B3|nr:bifunctional adenosylcobinamide kinase/adenosylcobinamide-phosphate guanylyltransferase [Microvirga pudoricolor]MBM6592971.1 bifunctional adenosylcobinamide kinase/adenosylcobinamide-phosphate guanylyltransferase [Microvirga pudoricolor]